MLRKSSAHLLAFATLWLHQECCSRVNSRQAGRDTAEQATQGKAAYEANCAACHGSDLMGAPPLAGEGFIGGWRTRSTRELYTLIRNSMPADNPGGLSENNYANIVAYILQFNGVPAGSRRR